MTLDLAAISLVLSSNRQVPAMEYPPTLRKHLQDLEEEVLSGDGRGSVHVRRKNSGYSALTQNSSESRDWASSEQPVTAGWEEDGGAIRFHPDFTLRLIRIGIQKMSQILGPIPQTSWRGSSLGI